jgi:hypothetical protein
MKQYMKDPAQDKKLEHKSSKNQLPLLKIVSNGIKSSVDKNFTPA